jgi:hypothetical protein
MEDQVSREDRAAAGSGSPSPGAPPKTPWIETREGGLFFLNAVLVAPELVVMVPLTLRTVFDILVPDRGASPFLDTIPFVASKSLPIIGWLLVIPIWTTVRNLKIARKPLARAALVVILLIHASFLGFAILSWLRILQRG